MPLVITGEEVEKGLEEEELLEFLVTHPAIVAANQAFTTSEVIPLTQATPALYVFQSECAADVTRDHALYVGSSEATTCHLLFLVQSRSGRPTKAYATHIASATDVEQSLVAMLGEGYMCVPALRAWVVGGFDDGTESAMELSIEIAKALQAMEEPVSLELFCVGHMNTHMCPSDHVPKPIVTGACFSFDLDTLLRCSFAPEERGPEQALRCAASILGGCRSVFNPQANTLEFSSVAYPVLMLKDGTCGENATDEEILNKFSTSPLAESAHFANDIRNALKFMAAHRDWHEYTETNGPRVYHRNGALEWVLATKGKDKATRGQSSSSSGGRHEDGNDDD